MDTVYTPEHHAHRGTLEFYRGELVPCFEKPERADLVLAAVQAAQLGAVIAPQAHPLAALERVHAPRYLSFLARAWDAWAALQPPGAPVRDALPAVWPIRSLRADVEPDNFIAQLGLYSYDRGSPLTAGTWTAARRGADVVLTAQALIRDGARAAFALTRPPGHHAGADFFGGYCFVNHAAVAAQAFIDQGAPRVAVLDVDYHHGNGTQSIFYDRADVLYVSVHGDPRTEYPFFLGHADETGSGAGTGCNLNLPLPAGASNAQWFAALQTGLARIAAHAPTALVVSLGVDTYEGDPISRFHLREPEFRRLGQRLAALGLPTLFVLEGGYAVAEIGTHVAAVLTAFDQAAQAAAERG